MREILFRGKRKDNGEWVKGFYVHLYDHKGNESHRIYPGYAETDCGDYYPDWFEVDPDTVGQFTGRVDKNGKKVFEHDILQLYTIWQDGTIEKYATAVVQFATYDQAYVLCCFADDLNVRYGDFGDFGRPEYYEVIGNIHDNPELLGGKQ